jgi:hypothetical protein
MISFTGTAPTGSSLGTTYYGNATNKGSVSVYVTANSKKSSGYSKTIYQSPNTSSDTLSSITGSASYAVWAWDGTATKTPTKSCTASYTRTWTSGST